MKHSAKAVAKLARERERLASRSGQPDRASASSATGQASTTAPLSATGKASATGLASGTGLPAPARAATATAVREKASRRRLAQVPYALVLTGIVLGLGLMQSGVQAVKGGTLVIAGALLAGSLTRLVLPEGRAGLLRSRRRLVDVAALTALGVGLLIAGLIVKVPS
jgi:hypothetical protein